MAVRKVSTKTKTAVFALLALLAYNEARAETWLTERPKDSVKARVAYGLALEGKDVYRCQPMRVNPRGGVTAVKGSKITFHMSVGKGIENFETLLKDGKKPVQCNPVELNNGRLVKSAEGAGDDE